MRGSEPKRGWASLIEALGVFLLIVIYIWWLRLYHPWLWVVILGFVVGTHFTHGEGPRWLGFAWDNFKAAVPLVAVWVGALAVVLMAIGLALRTLRQTTTRQAAASILGYVVWGLFQQYLLNGYFVNRLMEFSGKPHSRFVPLFAAALFSFVHAPNWFLMPVTLVGGYLCARLYLRFRSLYALALAHGILGFFLFLVVPDSISAHFLVGPRYLLDQYGIYPEWLL